MDDASEPQIDRRKIRLGLALIGLVLVAALVLLFAAEGAIVKALMFAIALTAFVRLYRLTRSLRQGS